MKLPPHVKVFLLLLAAGLGLRGDDFFPCAGAGHDEDEVALIRRLRADESRGQVLSPVASISDLHMQVVAEFLPRHEAVGIRVRALPRFVRESEHEPLAEIAITREQVVYPCRRRCIGVRAG